MNTHQPSGHSPEQPTIEEVLAAALRGEAITQDCQEQALSAFRTARDAGALNARPRRRDDWRPRRPRWFSSRPWRATAGAFLASLTLGGVALAAFGPSRTLTEHDTDQAVHPRKNAGPSEPGPDEPTLPQVVPLPSPALSQSVSPSPQGTSRSTAPERPPQAKNTEAHCRAYKGAKNHDRALNAPTWQRLADAAGGEQHIQAFCAALLSGSPSQRPTPTKEKGPEKDHEKKTEKNNTGTPQQGIPGPAMEHQRVPASEPHHARSSSQPRSVQRGSKND
jgi:hypothetical protein